MMKVEENYVGERKGRGEERKGERIEDRGGEMHG